LILSAFSTSFDLINLRGMIFPPIKEMARSIGRDLDDPRLMRFAGSPHPAKFEKIPRQQTTIAQGYVADLLRRASNQNSLASRAGLRGSLSFMAGPGEGPNQGASSQDCLR
jgi:hypothetical protein